jgi:methyltransferase-like protein
VRYEQVLVDLDGFHRDAAKAFAVGMPGKITNVGASTKHDATNFEQYRDYYANRKWRVKLSDEQVTAINTRLDRDIVARAGYEMLG